MGRFLRDQELRNLTIDQNTVRQLGHFLLDKSQAINAHLTEEERPKKGQLVTFIIRYDGKGYRHHDIEDLLKAYDQAKEVERITIQMDSLEAVLRPRLF